MSRVSLRQSFGHALSGLGSAIRSERNLRIELAIGALALGLSAYAGITRAEWAVILLTIGAVVSAEIANTVVEMLVDLVSPERNELAGAAKDAAASVVLLLAAISVAVGLLILGPPLYAKLFG